MTTLAEPPPRAPAGPRRGWLIAATVGWGLLLLVVTYVSFHHDEPTVREQRTIAQAVPVVDRAAGEVARAAQPAAVALLSRRLVTVGCRITSAREGAQLRREVVLHTSAGNGPAVIDRLRERLPAGYGTRVRAGADGRTDALRADAGEFVDVRGALVSPGIVQVTVATGCRPRSPGFDARAEPALRRPVHDVPERILASLRGTSVAPAAGTAAPCPGGGVAATASAEGRPTTMPARLSTALPAAGTVLVDEPDRYVYRDGDTGVVVEKQNDTVRASATTDCP